MEEEDKYNSPQWGGWEIVSRMLDNPGKYGIYPTSKCYQELYEFVLEREKEARADEREKMIEKIKTKFEPWGALPANPPNTFEVGNTVGRHNSHNEFCHNLYEYLKSLN
ncbi:MAG: hypothetical protein GY861_18210 [bacterium]|nr:hypothetical protein [bacterium]